MNIDITGEIHRIGSVEQITEKFAKRIVVVKIEDGQYPQFVGVQFINNNCGMVSELTIGNTATFKCNLRGRESTGKDGKEYNFTSLDCWRIEIDKGESKPQPTQPAPAPKAKQAPQPPPLRDVAPIAGSNEDNLPF